MKMKRSEKLGMFTGLVVGVLLIADQRVYDISDNMQSLGCRETSQCNTAGN